jgi:hypothetical protein
MIVHQIGKGRFYAYRHMQRSINCNNRQTTGQLAMSSIRSPANISFEW